MTMTSLDRLLELVHRTQLPTVIQSPESGEPCILLPLAVYEQLVNGRTVSTSRVKEPPTQREELPSTLVEMSLAFSEPSQSVEEPREGLRLQDLLHIQTPADATSSIFPTRPQIEALEDRFAFDGPDTRILPQMKQKQGFGNGASGSSEPTLA